MLYRIPREVLRSDEARDGDGELTACASRQIESVAGAVWEVRGSCSFVPGVLE